LELVGLNLMVMTLEVEIMKRPDSLLFLIIGIVLALGAGTAYAAHPAEGYEPAPSLFYDSEQVPSDWSYGELYFVDRAEKLDYSDLTDMEKYMVGGTEKGTGPYDSLPPWYMTIYATAAEFYSAFGYIPEVLTPEVIRSIPGLEELPDSQVNLRLNPLTGQWPRLQCREPSPGDMYMRPLTPDEVDHFTALDYGMKMKLVEHKGFDNQLYAQGTPWKDCWVRDLKITREMFYMRLYGESGILFTNFVGPICESDTRPPM
jgi:hypothetical protein